MLASITPLGERARNRRWGLTVTAYVTGSTVAGAIAGGVVGMVGDLLIGEPEAHRALVLSLAVVACSAGAALDLGVAGLRSPTIRRQVDESWLDRYRGWVCGVGFGAQLGVGVATVVTTASIYVTLVLALLSAALLPAGVIGATFGLVRALPLLGMRPAISPHALRLAHRRMQAWGPLVHRATSVSSAQRLAPGSWRSWPREGRRPRAWDGPSAGWEARIQRARRGDASAAAHDRQPANVHPVLHAANFPLPGSGGISAAVRWS